MNLTQTTALKWTFYALAAAALFFLRRLLLGSMTFFGVIPFLPPVILAVMASFELPRSAVIAGIVFGAVRPCAPRAIRVLVHDRVHVCGTAHLNSCQ